MSGEQSTALVWFRRDLRLHDNPTLAAAATADHLLPVYCFDPREFGPRPYGGPDSFEYEKTGPHRARFLRESVADLRESLRERDSALVVRHGRPEELLPDIADAAGASAVYCQTLPVPEERAVEASVESALADRGVELRTRWTHTLHHRDDLPTPVAEIADTFTPFKDRLEATSRVREPISTPELPPAPTPDSSVSSGSSDSSDWGAKEVPDADTLGVSAVEAPTAEDDRAALDFRGGESAGLARLDAYVWERDRLREYRETRNGLLGPDYSSKFSAWLNLGCLSPRRVHAEVERYEAERVENDSTYWLVFELRWRDFFQFQVTKHGAQLFRPEGIREREVEWSVDSGAFERWAAGQTGIPFVDAAMRELAATGYQSNRARQNAASFLANDLRIDWRRGAARFETLLVDYDPASNYGNWAYVAGVGNDARDRSFDVLWQAHRYDPDAEYVRTWCPELADVPVEKVHQPWTMTAAEEAEYGVELGADYPEPMVDPEIYEGPED
ncbi:DASH family cryptochrome [Halorussus salinus]|uniref:DASH family cryptochrome n=1 Tax=Halorussus salinus TaxID=1364935 RepID=UPI001092A790|nr:DASH family cryptochrome [Halorussus salinus]